MGNIAGVAKTFYMTMIVTSLGDLKDDNPRKSYGDDCDGGDNG